MPRHELLSSFNRINSLGNKFWDRFYQKFVESDKRVKTYFSRTDMIQQVTMMSQSSTIIMLQSDSEVPKSGYSKQLIHKHRHELSIPDELYLKWADCFISTLQELDPLYDLNIDSYWREAIEVFISPFLQEKDLLLN